MGLARPDGAGALLAASERLDGVLGSVAALLTVRHGFETAVASALGAAADAVAVSDADAAVAALTHLKDDDLGRARLVLAGGPEDAVDRIALTGGATYAVDAVECPDHLRGAVTRLLAGVVVVDDLASARALVADHPSLIAVTREGDLLGAHVAAGGSSGQPSLIEIQGAVDEATSRSPRPRRRASGLGFDLSRLETERLEAQKHVDVTLAKLHESDATLAAVAEELGQYGAVARAARGEADRLTQAITEAEAARDRDLAGLAELEQRLAAAEEAPTEEPDTADRERLAQEAKAARQREMDARLSLRTSEERARALHGRVDALVRQAAAEREARARAAERRERMLREGEAAEAVAVAASYALARLEVSLHEATRARQQVEQARSGREHQLLEVRGRLRDLGREHDELVSSVHRDELARAQQQMRLEQLAERALEELGLDVEGLVSEFGPDQPVPPSATTDVAEGDDPPEPMSYVRDGAAEAAPHRRAAQLRLGRVNPLALEEYSAMEERHKFLTEQLEDLKRTRSDLLDIVREVDARVLEVFTEAYADVSDAFDATFARLFPGGEGRLVLTDPDDLLNTGIEVEARPPGKKVKRLSLLSGGERSLVAVAFLVALFKARPSPFYILDEVEAALDDTNLGRLLQIYEELRENSQLLVITHQKRTMEVGDALYGVSMRGDGVSAVISQRLRDAQPA